MVGAASTLQGGFGLNFTDRQKSTAQRQGDNMTVKPTHWRRAIFEFIAAPATFWLACCALLVGWKMTYGLVGDEEPNDDK